LRAAAGGSVASTACTDYCGAASTLWWLLTMWSAELYGGELAFNRALGTERVGVRYT
jgi:hypothetical protein